MKEILSSMTTWMNMEAINLGETYQPQKDKYSTYMRNLQ